MSEGRIGENFGVTAKEMGGCCVSEKGSLTPREYSVVGLAGDGCVMPVNYGGVTLVLFT